MRFSKPFAPLLGSHKKLLINDVWRRRLLCNKGELEVVDDPVHHGIVGDEGDDAHLAATSGTEQRIDFKDLPNHLSPAFGRHNSNIFFNNKWKGKRKGCLMLSTVPLFH